MAGGKIAAAPAADKPFIGDPQQIITRQRAAKLAGTGAFLAAVINAERSTYRQFRCGCQINHRIPRSVAGQNFDLNRVLAHPVELLHTLFDIAQIKDFAFQTRKGHVQRALWHALEKDLL
ncbi:hypothetical protein D3C75_1046360 [compost metagenome]